MQSSPVNTICHYMTRLYLKTNSNVTLMTLKFDRQLEIFMDIKQAVYACKMSRWFKALKIQEVREPLKLFKSFKKVSSTPPTGNTNEENLSHVTGISFNNELWDRRQIDMYRRQVETHMLYAVFSSG